MRVLRWLRTSHTLRDRKESLHTLVRKESIHTLTARKESLHSPTLFFNSKMDLLDHLLRNQLKLDLQSTMKAFSKLHTVQDTFLWIQYFELHYPHYLPPMLETIVRDRLKHRKLDEAEDICLYARLLLNIQLDIERQVVFDKWMTIVDQDTFEFILNHELPLLMASEGIHCLIVSGSVSIKQLEQLYIKNPLYFTKHTFSAVFQQMPMDQEQLLTWYNKCPDKTWILDQALTEAKDDLLLFFWNEKIKHSVARTENDYQKMMEWYHQQYKHHEIVALYDQMQTKTLSLDMSWIVINALFETSLDRALELYPHIKHSQDTRLMNVLVRGFTRHQLTKLAEFHMPSVQDLEPETLLALVQAQGSIDGLEQRIIVVMGQDPLFFMKLLESTRLPLDQVQQLQPEQLNVFDINGLVKYCSVEELMTLLEKIPTLMDSNQLNQYQHESMISPLCNQPLLLLLDNAEPRHYRKIYDLVKLFLKTGYYMDPGVVQRMIPYFDACHRMDLLIDIIYDIMLHIPHSTHSFPFEHPFQPLEYVDNLNPVLLLPHTLLDLEHLRQVLKRRQQDQVLQMLDRDVYRLFGIKL
ncbi:hypothetical protein EDD86DRAFT_212232, partial [Gorgonomyces haynaldii]